MKAKRIFAFLLTLAMVISLVPGTAFAASSTYQLVVANKVELDGTEDKTVDVYFQSIADEYTYSLEANWSTSEIENSEYLKLTKLTPNGVNAMNNSTETGNVYWTDTSFNDPISTSAGGTIWTATYTVDKDTPVGTYTVSLTGKTTDSTYGENNFGTLEATITVEEPSAPPAPYEIYYTLDEGKPDSDNDKYIDYDINDTVTATVKLKNNTAETMTLQAYDIYLTYHVGLIYKNEGMDGTAYKTEADATSNDAVKAEENDIVTHIQLVADGNAYKTLAPNEPVLLGTVTFNIDGENADVKYDTALPITLTEDTNISLAEGAEDKDTEGYDTTGKSQAYYPAIVAETLGAEVMTKYEVKYEDGVDDEEIAVPAATYKEHNKNLDLSFGVGERTGYSFLGWSETKGAETATYTTEEGKGTYTENKGTTLYAVWQKNTVTVTFDANGGSGNMDAQEVPYNTAAALNGYTFTRTGYTFAGWNTVAKPDEDNPGISYANGANITITEDTTLYAQWSINKYTVTWYNQDGTTVLEEDVNVDYGTAPDFGLDDPVMTETAQYTYTFEGWATSPNQESGTKEENLPAVSDNTNYWAAFSKTLRSYQVTFNMKGHGDAIDAQTVEYNNTAIEPNAPTADHYDFEGWYTDADCTKAYNFTTPVTGPVTLYAKWTPKTYTVTFAAGEGSGNMDPQTFTYGESQPLTANGFTAPIGKVFDGWKDEGGKPYSNQENISLSGDIKLTAQWSFNPYTVTADQDVQNGSVGVNKGSANYGETITVTVIPAEGYEIGKVTYTPDGDDEQTIDPVDGTYSFFMPDANVTVSATFERKNLIVKVESADNGDVNIEAGENDVLEKTDAKVKAPITLNVVPKTGYKVKSVTYVKTGDTEAVAQDATKGENNTYTFTMPAYGVTVKAEFEAISYTIAFDGNDATTGEMSAMTGVKYDSEVKLTKNAFTKNGYTFAGWLYNGTTYADEAAVKNLASVDEANVTLVAQWDVATYKITYDSQGGSEVAEGSYTYGEGLNTLPTPTKTGYNFAGWYEGDTKVESISETAFGDKALIAKWTEATYSVKLNTNEGTITEDKNVTEYTYGTGATLPTANDITKPGYTFEGWYTNQELSGNKVTAITGTDVGEKEYWAKWTANPYTITFDFDGGTIDSNHAWNDADKYDSTKYELSYTIESPDTLPNATKTGYTFTGWLAKYVEGVDQNWCVAEDGETPKDTAYNVSTPVTGKYGNITMVAQWKRNVEPVVEEYKYADDGYWMIRVADTLDENQEYRFDGEPLYYIEDSNYAVENNNKVFYTLIPADKGGVTYVDNGALTEAGYGLLTVDSCESRSTITYGGDINGDGVVNIADANVVYQMTNYKGVYYAGQLTVEQRLGADMDKVMTTGFGEARGSIADVEVIVDIINGVTATN